MKNVTRHPRIVEALIDSEITIKGQRFVEYFNMPGLFYPEDLDKPTGIGAPFQKYADTDWIDAGKVKILDTIHFKETKWWKHVQKNLLDDLQKMLKEREELNARINDQEMILFDPITYYAKD